MSLKMFPLLIALSAPLAAQTAEPETPAPPPGAETTLSLNAKVLAEIRAQNANRAAQTAQYKGAVAVQNQKMVEVQRFAEESEADYAARVAAWQTKTAEACATGNAEACAKINR